MSPRKIEIFTGNCPLCEDTVKLVQELAGNNCEIQIYNIQEPSRLKHYTVKAVPSIAIDGALVLVGKPSRTQLEAGSLWDWSKRREILYGYVPRYGYLSYPSTKSVSATGSPATDL